MLRNYLKIALRSLRRDKRLFLLNLSGLSIGMACALLLLLYVRHELTYDRHHRHADQIYRLACSTKMGEAVTEFAALPPAVGPALAQAIPEIEQVARFQREGKLVLKKDNEPFLQEGIYFADSSLLRIFTYQFVWGNENALREKGSILLTRTLAEKLFGDNMKSPLGKTIQVHGLPLVVSGVVEDPPTNSHFGFSALVARHSFPFGDPWDDAHAYTYVRLKDSVDPAIFKAKLKAFVAKEPHLIELAEKLDAHISVIPQALPDIHLNSRFLGELSPPGNRTYVYAFALIAFFLLLCAGVNYTNLAITATIRRSKEIGVRKVLGARGWQIGKQFLTESLLTTFCATVLGLGLAWLCLPYFRELVDKPLSFRLGSLPAMVGWLGVLILVVGVLSGAYPAFYLSRLQPTQVLKSGSRVAGSSWGVGNVLVVGQFMLSIVVIALTLLVKAQLAYVSQKDLGFTKENVLIVSIPGMMAKHGEAFKADIKKLAGVREAAACNYSPGYIPKDEHRIERADGTMQTTTVPRLHIDHSYLPMMGMQMVQGRGFDPAFGTDFSSAFLVNEAAVKAFGWKAPGQTPIGKKIEGFNYGKTGTVIGVVKDAHLFSLRQKIEPMVFNLSPRDYSWGESLYIRLNNARIPETLEAIKQTHARVFDHFPFEYSFLDEQYDRLYKDDQRMSLTLQSGAFIMIFISCLGIFGLSAYEAVRRTKETAIRKVLGASLREIVRLHVRRFAIPVLLANGLAWPLAYFLMQAWLQDFAYRIGISFFLFPLAGLLTLSMVLMTVGYHAFQTARHNPVQALKYE